ncbi:hypothetical protein [Amycolatopsis sp. NPDC003861]
MTSPPSPDVAALVAPDGSVTVPADLAGEVLKFMVFAFTEHTRTTGAMPTSRAVRFLRALDVGRQRHENGGTPPDSPPAAPGRSVREVADEMGCTPQRVRQLLAAGRLPGRKTRGGWIVYSGHQFAHPQGPQRTSATLITATERQARDVG